MPSAKRRQPKKPAPAQKQTPKNGVSKRARRVKIVEGLVKQNTPKQIAKSIGISRKTLYEELKAPETQQLIQRWMEPYHDDIEALIPQAITAVRDAIGASHRIVVPDEELGSKEVEVPNEPIDRLRAVKTLGVMLSWAQGKTSPDAEASPIRKFDGTMEELLIVYRNVTTQPADRAA